jgi:hypothetical protein
MDIKISEESLQEAINLQINNVVIGAIGGYSVQEALSKKIAESFSYGVIADAIDAALKSIDTGHLITSLSFEMAKATTRAAVACMTDGLVETLVSIRKIPSYDDEKLKNARMEIKAMLTRE